MPASETIPGKYGGVSAASSNDVDWVSRLRAGDRAAFREFIERYQSKIYALLFGIVRNRQDVDEIAAKVFAKAYCRIKSYEGRTPLWFWIYQIAINECYNFVGTARGDLNGLLARLSEDDRFLLILREVEGVSVVHLAELMRLNETALKAKLFRARRRLIELSR